MFRTIVLRCALVGVVLVGTVGCPGSPAEPPPDAGSVDARLPPGIDAPGFPGADVPIAPGTDAPPPSSWRPTPVCTDDADCDDGLACTDDACELLGCPPGAVDCGRCSHSPRPGRCGASETCDDRFGCVAATACARDADCADDSPCTTGERCDPSARVCVRRTLDGDFDGDAPPICGGTDCDDADPYTRPGAPDVCNGADDDCDALVDETASTLCGPGLTCVAAGSSAFCDCADPAQTQCEDWDPTLGVVRRCYDTSRDHEHCGGCYTACPADAECVDGECACATPGHIACDSTCIDPLTDPFDCGYCGNFCRSGQVCSAGSCRACGGAGEPCCEGATCDSATLACDGTTCALRACALRYDPLPAAYLPRCTASTLSCLRACGTSSCRTACLANDTTAPYMGVDCADCVDLQFLACLDDAGCGDEWATYECCYADNCPAGSPAGCDTPCASARTAWMTCVGRSSCYADAGFTLQCYAP